MAPNRSATTAVSNDAGCSEPRAASLKAIAGRLDDVDKQIGQEERQRRDRDSWPRAQHTPEAEGSLRKARRRSAARSQWLAQ